jgi:hypothetical protein
MKSPSIFAKVVLSAALTTPLVGYAGDAGELFPDVPAYRDNVASPVTHQEESLKKPAVPVVPQPTTVAPQPPPVIPPLEPVSPTEPAHNAPKSVPVAPAPKHAPAPKPARVIPHTPIWTPYSKTVFLPLLTAEDRVVFDRDYAPQVGTALRGTPEERRAASDELFGKAEAGTDSPTLRRCLYLHALGLAIRGASPLEDREKKARAVLPLLTERTLAVAQARADCLENLTQSGLNNASQALFIMVAHSYATLAELQAQAGYPKEATASLARSRKWLLSARDRNPLLAAQLAATTDWVNRANLVDGMLPGLKQKLEADPKDDMANTQLALIQLGLYGNLSGALNFAGDSSKPELQKLKQLTKGLPLDTLTCQSPEDAQASLPIIAALGDVARSVTGPDRFLIANFANHRLDAISSVISKTDLVHFNLMLRKISDKITETADPYESLNGPPVGPAQTISVDGHDPQVQYKGRWSQAYMGNRGTVTETNTPGAEASLTFVGTKVRWFGYSRSDMGKADVVIDDQPAKAVDCYGTTATAKATMLYESDPLPDGKHTITVRMSSTAKANGQSGPIDIDSFEYIGHGTEAQAAGGPVFHNIADMFANCPSLPQQFAAQNFARATATNRWAAKNLVGARLNLTSEFQYSSTDFGGLDQARQLCIHTVRTNIVVGDVSYRVNIDAHVPSNVADAAGQLQPGQDLDVNGVIESVTVQARAGDPTIYIVLKGTTTK